jgi:hypothetical protein
MIENNLEDKYKKMGDDGWKEARERLSNDKWNLQQIDWLGEKNGEWVKFEIKFQEPFEPPPFFGHGLPRWQVNSSEKLQIDKGIRTYLMVKDAKDNNWYGQFLDELEKGEFKDTFGKKPRRVYKRDNFKLL